MNERNTPEADHRTSSSAQEEALGRLIEQAGPRPQVPPEDLERIKNAFRSAWEAEVGATPSRRTWWPVLAAAAAVVMAVGLGVWWGSGDSSRAPVVVASIEALEGVVSARSGTGEGDARTILEKGQTIAAGTELETLIDTSEPGRVALRLSGGASLRIDRGTRVRLASADVVFLEAGTVYVDTGQVQQEGGDGVEIRTALGVVHDVGTQFEVHIGEGSEAEMPSLRVRVREGAVMVRQGETTEGASAGEELTLRADGTEPLRQPLSCHGPDWEWVLSSAPPYPGRDRPLSEFLHWVQRETCWEIRYEDESLRASAERITVWGTVPTVKPHQPEAVFMATRSLSYEVLDGVLILRRREGTGP